MKRVFVGLVFCMLLQIFAVPVVFGQTTLIPDLQDEQYGAGADLAGKATGPCVNLALRFTTGDFEVSDVPCYAVYLVEFFIWLVASIAVLFVVIGGYQYIFSGTSDDKETGKHTITYALSGLAITVLAWTVVNWVQVLVTGGEAASGEKPQPQLANRLEYRTRTQKLTITLPPGTSERVRQDILRAIEAQVEVNDPEFKNRVIAVAQNFGVAGLQPDDVSRQRTLSKPDEYIDSGINVYTTAGPVYHCPQNSHNATIPLELAWIAAEEGYHEIPQKDNKAVIRASNKTHTVGIGHQVNKDEYWDSNVAVDVFLEDVAIAKNVAENATRAHGIDLHNLHLTRQITLLNMAFQMGEGSEQGAGLRSFKKMLSFIKAERYNKAAREITCNNQYCNPTLLSQQTSNRASTYASVMATSDPADILDRIFKQGAEFVIDGKQQTVVGFLCDHPELEHVVSVVELPDLKETNSIVRESDASTNDSQTTELTLDPSERSDPNLGFIDSNVQADSLFPATTSPDSSDRAPTSEG